jgi:hypothetical protein
MLVACRLGIEKIGAILAPRWFCGETFFQYDHWQSLQPS